MKQRQYNRLSRLTRGRFQFTDTGQAIFLGTCFVLLATLAIPAFGIFGSLVALQIIGLLLGILFRPRLNIESIWPQRVMAGEAIQATFTVHNRSRFTGYQLELQLEDIHPAFEPIETTTSLPLLPAGATQTVTLSLRCRQRGRYTLPRPSCFSGFPFNLYRFGIKQHEALELLVVPAYFRLYSRQSNSVPTASHSGRHTHTARGLSVEYLGNRPFMRGDSPHRIDARAWARLATPAIKEFFDETQHHVAIWFNPCIDRSSSPLTAQQNKTLEAAVQLTASLSYSLSRDVVLGHLLLGSHHYKLTGGSLAQRINRVHDLLATVTVSDRPVEDTTLRDLIAHVDSLNELCIITQTWHTYGQRLVDYANQAGVKVTLLCVAETDPQVNAEKTTPWPQTTQWIAPDQILRQEVTIW
ncbi:DUF58 domain-containing protein [Planctomycetota bacterium]